VLWVCVRVVFCQGTRVETAFDLPNPLLINCFFVLLCLRCCVCVSGVVFCLGSRVETV